MKGCSSPILRSDARPVYAISLPLNPKLPHLPLATCRLSRPARPPFCPGLPALSICTDNEDFQPRLQRCRGFLGEPAIVGKYRARAFPLDENAAGKTDWLGMKREKKPTRRIKSVHCHVDCTQSRFSCLVYSGVLEIVSPIPMAACPPPQRKAGRFPSVP